MLIDGISFNRNKEIVNYSTLLCGISDDGIGGNETENFPLNRFSSNGRKESISSLLADGVTALQSENPKRPRWQAQKAERQQAMERFESAVQLYVKNLQKLSQRIKITLPAEIDRIASVESSEVDWRAVTDECRRLLRQLGANTANEADTNAVCMGRNLEYLLICSIAIETGNVRCENVRRFARGSAYGAIYVYSDGGKNYTIKRIIPHKRPGKYDDERRYGISQFSAVARNLAPGVLNDFLANLGRTLKIDVPKVYVPSTVGVINGYPGLVMWECQNHPVGNRHLQLNGNFRRQEAWLQLMDCILGEMDRHGRNVFWYRKQLQAIDNDFSFIDQELRNQSTVAGWHRKLLFIDDAKREKIRRTNLANTIPLQRYVFSNEVRQTPVDGTGPISNYCMPPVIDQEMAKLFLGIDGNELRVILLEIGCLDRQINAAINRLRDVQKLINGRQITIISADSWGVNPEIVRKCTCENSYFLAHFYPGALIIPKCSA